MKAVRCDGARRADVHSPMASISAEKTQAGLARSHTSNQAEMATLFADPAGGRWKTRPRSPALFGCGRSPRPYPARSFSNEGRSEIEGVEIQGEGGWKVVSSLPAALRGARKTYFERLISSSA